LRGLSPRLRPGKMTNLAMELLVQTHQHGRRTVGRADRGAKTLSPFPKPRPERRGFQERNQFLRQRRRVSEWEVFGVGLDEKVEWVDDRHVGDQIDQDLELAGPLREDETRHPVAVGVLLPVEEMLRWLDLQRIAND